MALLINQESDAGYLAVELTVDKRTQPITPFVRGPVASWDLPEEVYEALRQAEEELEADWLNCTIRFVVGTAVIYQQTLLVQYTTFWEWYHVLNTLVTTEHQEDRHLYSGSESPELRMHLVRSYYARQNGGRNLERQCITAIHCSSW